MSAYLCSEKHLSTLAFELVRRHVVDQGVHTTEKSVFQSLVKTNLDSLKARYSDTEEEQELSLTYTYKPEKGLTPIQVYKLAECYAYQSCEHNGWEDSQEKMWMEALKDSIIYNLPEYKAASWSID